MVQSSPSNFHFYNPNNPWSVQCHFQAVPGTAVLHRGSSPRTDKAFPGAFLPLSLNNQASGLPSAGGPSYLQSVPAACKSPAITRGGKQKLMPTIQSLQVMVWQRFFFWATDLHWGFSSQKTVNKWRGRRQHSLGRKKNLERNSMRYRWSCLKALSQCTWHRSQLLL